MKALREQIDSLSPERYARAAKRSAELAKKLADRANKPVSPAIEKILATSEADLAIQRERALRRRDTSILTVDTSGSASTSGVRENGVGAPQRESTLPGLLQEAVSLNPNGIAVSDGVVELLHSQLDERAYHLARLLVERGCGAEHRVAVAIPPSVDFVIANWAVWRAGSATVPVDVMYTDEEIAYLLSDSGVSAGVTIAAARELLPDSVEWLIIDDLSVVDLMASMSSGALSNEQVPVRASNAACVLYPSGSLGPPRGVVLTHDALVNLSYELCQRYETTVDSRVLLHASPVSDVAVLEMLLAIGASARMIVAPHPGLPGKIDKLQQILRDGRVTHAWMEPPLLRYIDPSGLDTLRVIIAPGATIQPELISKWAATDAWGRRKVTASYGPVEAPASVISAPLAPGSTLAIGEPIRGTSALILDSTLRPVPVGSTGELYLAGTQLARGYHGQVSATAERFVANPATIGERMYRTGNFTRWTSDGSIEYLGRVDDFQVKVRGARIDLGEIDEALVAHRAVEEAVTVVKKNAVGEAALVSYVISMPGYSIDTDDLIDFLSDRLPGRPLPESIVVAELLHHTSTATTSKARPSEREKTS